MKPEIAYKPEGATKTCRKCKTSLFGYESRGMLKVSQRCGKLTVAIFRVNMYWLGFFRGHGAGSRRLVRRSDPSHLTLRMTSAIFAEKLDNFQRTTTFIPESRSFTLNSSRENPRKIISECDYRIFTCVFQHMSAYYFGSVCRRFLA
jgi:hypothetical protein